MPVWLTSRWPAGARVARGAPPAAPFPRKRRPPPPWPPVRSRAHGGTVGSAWQPAARGGAARVGQRTPTRPADRYRRRRRTRVQGRSDAPRRHGPRRHVGGRPRPPPTAAAPQRLPRRGGARRRRGLLPRIRCRRGGRLPRRPQCDEFVRADGAAGCDQAGTLDDAGARPVLALRLSCRGRVAGGGAAAGTLPTAGASVPAQCTDAAHKVARFDVRPPPALPPLCPTHRTAAATSPCKTCWAPTRPPPFASPPA